MGLFDAFRKPSEEELNVFEKELADDKRRIDDGYAIFHDKVRNYDQWCKHYKAIYKKMKQTFYEGEWQRYWAKNEDNKWVVALKFKNVETANIFYCNFSNYNSTMWKDLDSDTVYFSSKIYNTKQYEKENPKYRKTNIYEVYFLWQIHKLLDDVGIPYSKISDIMRLVTGYIMEENRDYVWKCNDKGIEIINKDMFEEIRSKVVKRIGGYKKLLPNDAKRYVKDDSELEDGTVFTSDEKKKCLEILYEAFSNEKNSLFKVRVERLNSTMNWDILEARFSEYRDSDGNWITEMERDLIPMHEAKFNKLHSLFKFAYMVERYE